jgi:hypothetical protein
MGYGNAGESSLPTTFFKIKGLKMGSSEIYFEGKQKIGDKYSVISSKPNSLFGHLTDVSIKEFEWEDETHKVVRLVLDSADDRVILEGGFSNVMINLINTIAGNDSPIDKLKLNVYISKKGYASMGIEIDNQDWKDNKWKFDYQNDLKPLIEEITNKKGKITGTDKSDLIDFLVKEIESKEFQSKINGNPPSPTVVEKPVITEEVTMGEDDDDLPF